MNRTILTGLVLIFCTISTVSKGIKKEDEAITITHGEFSFKLPKGWQALDISKMGPLLADGFTGGYIDSKAEDIPAYFLIKPTNHKISAIEKELVAKNNETPNLFSDIKAFFKTAQSPESKEFYSKKHDVSIFCINYGYDTWPNKSIMLKRFGAQGALVLHFYCGSSIDDDIAAVKTLVKHFTVHPVKE